MSEEEKEAIKETKQVIEKWNDTNWLISYDHKNLEILLNLIDKLQKENNKYIKEQNNVTIMETEYFKDKYISKDIIRNKIKELEENSSTVSVFEIDILKELLGE